MSDKPEARVWVPTPDSAKRHVASLNASEPTTYSSPLDYIRGLQADLARERARADMAERLLAGAQAKVAMDVAEIAALRRKREELRELLRKVEWRTENCQCVLCHRQKWEGHAPGCGVGAEMGGK